MEINEKSIRIRSFNEKDLAWHKYIDWEKQDLTVPCFFNGTDSMVYSEFLRPSLDLLHFRKLCKIREKETGEKYIIQKRDEEYTDVFIVVTMDNNKSIFRIPEGKREVLHAREISDCSEKEIYGEEDFKRGMVCAGMPVLFICDVGDS